MRYFNYAGTNRKKNYFEGWFLRIVDSNNNCYSFIFGITLNEEDPHSFIQIIDQNQPEAYYFRFDISDFHYEDGIIKIKNNIISMSKLQLKIDPFNINLSIKPNLHLKNQSFTGGAMGVFKYLPFPVHHEIIFMKANVKGTIKTKNRNSNIHGLAYMEKDFGTRFPKKWFWIQANHFKKHNISLVISKADIFGKISGFFGFLNFNNKEFRFATYNCSKIKHHSDGENITITTKKGKYKLIIEVIQKPGHLIIAPIEKAKMEKEIEESVISTLKLSLYKGKTLIVQDNAINVACEYLYPNDSNNQ